MKGYNYSNTKQAKTQLEWEQAMKKLGMTDIAKEPLKEETRRQGNKIVEVFY